MTQKDIALLFEEEGSSEEAVVGDDGSGRSGDDRLADGGTGQYGTVAHEAGVRDERSSDEAGVRDDGAVAHEAGVGDERRPDEARGDEGCPDNGGVR